MDESGAIQTQPLGHIKMCVAVIKLLRLKSLTFGGHLKLWGLFFIKSDIITLTNIWFLGIIK